MTSRLSVLLLAMLLAYPALAKDKKKASMPEYILKAQTVLVVIDPEAGEPLDQPYANSMARDNVEKALSEWGRFRLVMDGEESDLIISIRTSNGKGVQPTIKGGPTDQRPGVGQVGDSTIRIGGQSGQTTPLSDPSANPPRGGPHISDVADWSEDAFQVYQGGVKYPLDGSPMWRYVAKDCLRPPKISAVEEFRKAVAAAEQARQTQQPKKP